MLDLKFIRENNELVKKAFASKNFKFDLDTFLKTDQTRRNILLDLEGLRRQKNEANDEITKLIKEKQDPKPKIASMKEVASKINALEEQLKGIEKSAEDALLLIPNIPHASVPVGDLTCNKVVRAHGEPKKFKFKPKTHMELGEGLDILDFGRAVKISASNFSLFKGAGAALQRALMNFMIDIHTKKHGYREVWPPILVNRASMTGTGQLPKFEEEMYRLKDDDLFLIPTAEVPLTNLHRDEILKEEDLPLYYTAWTPCFRREAGTYGKDTKGLIRVHEFDKVEMVKFVKPEDSYDELEKLVKNAEKIFQLLKIPYRVVLLASGDLSFAAAKCYDLEAYAPGVDKWLEVSSCSNFESFQARRANIRYRPKDDKKLEFVHTLNGSGLAFARLIICIMENYQNPDGTITVPKALVPYMKVKKIGK